VPSPASGEQALSPPLRTGAAEDPAAEDPAAEDPAAADEPIKEAAVRPAADVIPLFAELRRLPGLGDVEPIPWTGPRWWWSGPLDVEGLALGSLQALGSALVAEGRSRRRQHEVTTSSAAVAASFDSFARLRVGGVAAEGFAPLSGFRRTRDGWIRLHANYPHHEHALLTALGTTAEGLDDALLERTAQDVEDRVTAGGGVAGAVRTPGQWLAGPTGRWNAAQPWIRFDTTTEAADPRPRRGGTASAATPPAETWRAGKSSAETLPGLRILDLTRVIAGPSATRLLAALGADVLRVDPPHIPELREQYVDTGFSKRSALADARVPGDLAAVRRLAARADVVITGYRPGALARFGLDAPSLMADHRGLVVVSLDAWGDGGPWAGRRGFDSVVQAATGIAHRYGTGLDGGWRPGALPVQALDHATGLGAAAAALALVVAGRAGVRASAHLSLARTATELLRAEPPDPLATPTDLTHPGRRASSAYGELDFVPPPLIVDGHQIEHTHPPPRYGSSPLTWL
jgi:hypothetical protein